MPLCLVVGALDVMHTPQLARWAAGRRYKFVKTERKGLPPVARVEKVVGWQEGDQEDDTAVLKVVFTPWMDHIMLIHGLTLLHLWDYPRIWMSSKALQRSLTRPNARPNARL